MNGLGTALRCALALLAAVVMMGGDSVAAQEGSGGTVTAERIEADLAGPFRTRAADVSWAKHGEMARALEPMMGQQARSLIGQLKPWNGNPGARTLSKAGSGEHDILLDAYAVYSLAVMARAGSDFGPYAPSHRDIVRASEDILRFLLPAHGAGKKPLADGKTWGGQWQSALWANSAGRAAWLLWDDIPPSLRWLAARMIADEADRFLDVTPPARIVSDTKAEENAWNSQIIALAAAMFPNHPRAAAWREAATRWALSCFIREADLAENPTVDGRTLKEWGLGANLYDDYTLENHDRVHPDYMAAIKNTLMQRIVYEWGGQPSPEATAYNTRGVYATLKKLALPDGSFLYPNGQDWRMHRNADGIITHATQAVWYGDRQAARLLRICLDTAQRMMARDRDGGLYAEGENDTPTTEAYVFEIMANAYVLLRAHGEGPGPVSEVQLWRDLAGRHLFASGQFGVLRTPEFAASFSWGPQPMGLALPLQMDLLVTPHERGLIGHVAMDGLENESPKVREAKVIPMPDALAVAGVLERAGGRIEQRFAYLALPDGRVLYVDRLTAADDAPMPGLTLALGSVGILNDPYWVHHDARRTVHHAGGSQTFEALAGSAAPVNLPSPWANVDGELGLVVLAAPGGLRYTPNHTPSRGRVEQRLDVGIVEGRTAGKTLAETAILLLPGRDAGETREMSAKCRIERAETGADHPSFLITLDDGRRVTLDLDALAITVSGG